MTALPGASSPHILFPAPVAIYADDVTPWYVGISTQVQSKWTYLQEPLTAVSGCFKKTCTASFDRKNVVHITPLQTTSLVFPPAAIFFKRRVNRVRNYRYFGLVIDDRLTWPPAVAEVIAEGRKVFSIRRKLGGPRWGGFQISQPLLYHGLVVFRCLHGLPLISLSAVQWRRLGTMRVASSAVPGIRMCGRMDKFVREVFSQKY